MYTLEQYNSLKAAIATGSQTVKYGDKTVEYRSLSEMTQILRMMETELFPAPTAPGLAAGRRVVEFSKGLK